MSYFSASPVALSDDSVSRRIYLSPTSYGLFSSSKNTTTNCQRVSQSASDEGVTKRSRFVISCHRRVLFFCWCSSHFPSVPFTRLDGLIILMMENELEGYGVMRCSSSSSSTRNNANLNYNLESCHAIPRFFNTPSAGLGHCLGLFLDDLYTSSMSPTRIIWNARVWFNSKEMRRWTLRGAFTVQIMTHKVRSISLSSPSPPRRS